MNVRHANVARRIDASAWAFMVVLRQLGQLEELTAGQRDGFWHGGTLQLSTNIDITKVPHTSTPSWVMIAKPLTRYFAFRNDGTREHW
jgi:hypothetical protein